MLMERAFGGSRNTDPSYAHAQYERETICQILLLVLLLVLFPFQERKYMNDNEEHQAYHSFLKK